MLSATQEYALRAMTQLARKAPSSAKTADIAKAVEVPGSYLAKIIRDLRIAGLVRSQRGVNGGVSLAKPPKNITLLDVMETVEPLRNGQAVRGKSPLDRKLKILNDQLQKSAAATTLADVTKR